jgi:hypothetical protein
MLSFICTTLFCANDLMKSHCSIWVVRRWHGLHADPVRKCFDDPEGMNNRYLPSGCSPRVHEPSNGLRLGTIVSSQDLSGVWFIVHG